MTVDNYVDKHWQVFSSLKYQSVYSGGREPKSWFEGHNLAEPPADLPDKRLDRNQLKIMCKDTSTPALLGYCCVMAWGGQGGGGNGSRNVKSAWQEKEVLNEVLQILRTNDLSRREAYDLFSGDNKIKGLGPAYWTKLLYFFSPKSDCYIMDQWTSKSINLLVGEQVIKMEGHAVAQTAKSGCYQAYCEEVDNIAKHMGLPGEQVEEMLMSGKGQVWRNHVKQHYDYHKATVTARYPHIPNECF